VAFLAREIAEQKRVDLAVASSSAASLSLTAPPSGLSGAGLGSAGAGHTSPHPENPGSYKDFVIPSATGGTVPVAPLLGGGGAGLGGGAGGPSGANIHVVLPGDRDAQRRKHRAKIAYHEKGAQSPSKPAASLT
jgi:hypothetical protein